MIKKISKLILFILICQLTGIIGYLFTAPAIDEWYDSINKPFFNPPNWLFSPVWIILYLLMGISLYLIWGKGIKQKKIRKAVNLFFIQLILNSLWSYLFFGLRSPFLGFIEIIVLFFFISLTAIHFYRISKKAGWLFAPYVLWVAFASVLNFSIWYLN